MSEGVERIEFLFGDRHFRINYWPNCRVLEEYITPKERKPYWRHVPPYGRTRQLRKDVLGNRKKKDFIEMGIPLRWIEAGG